MSCKLQRLLVIQCRSSNSQRTADSWFVVCLDEDVAGISIISINIAALTPYKAVTLPNNFFWAVINYPGTKKLFLKCPRSLKKRLFVLVTQRVARVMIQLTPLKYSCAGFIVRMKHFLPRQISRWCETPPITVFWFTCGYCHNWVLIYWSYVLRLKFSVLMVVRESIHRYPYPRLLVIMMASWNFWINFSKQLLRV